MVTESRIQSVIFAPGEEAHFNLFTKERENE